MKTIACIGCGNMGGAIMRGLAELCAAGGPALTLLGVDHNPAKVTACNASPVDMKTVADTADLIILAVKPYDVPATLKSLFPVARTRTRSPLPVVLSVAAGVSVPVLSEAVSRQAAVIRCMPNTPVSVGMGSFALCFDDPALTPTQREAVRELFSRLGKAIPMAETRFPAFSAMVGCGPAYIFYVIEALAEAGVSMGFSRAEALDMAAYLTAGSAKLATDSGTHPAILREAVCSPAGSTIQGVMKLDELAVKSALAKAVHAAWAREKERER